MQRKDGSSTKSDRGPNVTGLVRKPTSGETLIDGNGKRWRVTGFGGTPGRTFGPDICIIEPADGGHETQFIWQFRDGLNNWFTHSESTR